MKFTSRFWKKITAYPTNKTTLGFGVESFAENTNKVDPNSKNTWLT
jgi:hypothetical protein